MSRLCAGNGGGGGVLSSSEPHGQRCPLSGEELRPEEKRARVLGAEPTGAGSGAPALGSWRLIRGRSSPGVWWVDLLERAESSWGPGLRKRPSQDFRCDLLKLVPTWSCLPHGRGEAQHKEGVSLGPGNLEARLGVEE